jgi:hypothetical protein
VTRATVTLCLGFAVLGALFSCAKPLSVEQQVIATILEMKEHIEAGERLAFLGYVSEDFSGQHGAMNRDQLRGYVILQLNRYKKLRGKLFPIEVEDQGDGQATAWFRALVTGGPGWLPESGQVFEFETHWRQDGDEWLVTAANWEPIGLEDAL